MKDTNCIDTNEGLTYCLNKSLHKFELTQESIENNIKDFNKLPEYKLSIFEHILLYIKLNYFTKQDFYTKDSSWRHKRIYEWVFRKEVKREEIENKNVVVVEYYIFNKLVLKINQNGI